MDEQDSEQAPSSSQAMRCGRLRDTPLPQLLWQLHEARRTGCLRVEHNDVVKQLWLADGQMVFARSTQASDRLTDRLLARGLLSRAQFDAAQTLIATTRGKRVGELLVEAGLILARDLHEALNEHLLHMLDTMFLWVDGDWNFEADVVCNEPLTLNVATAAIIMGGARHRIPLKRLWETVGDTGQYPQLSAADRSPTGQAALADELQLEPNETLWLPRLDGHTSLHGFLDDFNTDEHELLALLYTLKTIHRLELASPEPQPFSHQRQA